MWGGKKPITLVEKKNLNCPKSRDSIWIVKFCFHFRMKRKYLNLSLDHFHLSKIGLARETACLGTNIKLHILFYLWYCFKIALHSFFYFGLLQVIFPERQAYVSNVLSALTLQWVSPHGILPLESKDVCINLRSKSNWLVPWSPLLIGYVGMKSKMCALEGNSLGN